MGNTNVISVGSKVPEFVLKDQNGDTFKLSDFRGKRMLLSFHPLAWTSICAAQMKSLENHVDTLGELNAVAVGLSIDSVPCKQAWAKELGINRTALLSDFWPHGGVAELFGLFRTNEGFSERANIIMDENGKVVFVKVYPIKELPDIMEIIEFIRG